MSGADPTPVSCTQCGRDLSTEPVVRPDGSPARLCPDCPWLYANMGWLAGTDPITDSVIAWVEANPPPQSWFDEPDDLF